MRTPVIDGRSIEQFIPRHLRGMFYNHAMPQYKYAIHDGYAPYNFTTDGLVMYLPLWALEGDSIKSVDAYKHVCTVDGALWRPDSRLFDGDDYIDCGKGAAMNLGGALTILGWIKTDAININTERIIANSNAVGGRAQYQFRISNQYLRFTSLSGFGFNSLVGTSAALTAGTRHFAAVTLTAADGTATLYVDNVADVTTGAWDATKVGTFADSGNTCVGRNGDQDGGYMVGSESEIWLFNRCLSTVEMTHIYNCTKWRYP